MLFGRSRNKKNQAPASASTPTFVLEESKESLDRSIVNLSKKKGVNLDGHTARVVVVMDRSGSMSDLFYGGDVQEILSRLLPVALKFDDNGELEVFLFNENCKQVKVPMTEGNYSTYVEEEILHRGLCPSGGTNYAPLVNETLKHYNDGSNVPAFVIVITDGENFDRHDTDQSIRKSSEYPVFYQFIGIGSSSFDYLEKLDDLDGRKVDNTAFLKFQDIKRLSDDELYSALLEQYPQWLKDTSLI